MTDGSTVHAVKGLDLQLPDQGATAVIGESGSGKSVSMRAILGLLPSNAKVAGSARLDLGSGDTVEQIGAGKNRLRRLRGQAVGMVFQNAMDALNPSLTLERQLTEAVLWHGLGTRQEARRRAVEALGEVGIHEPGEGGLPGSRFADDPEGAAPGELEGDVVHGADRTRRPGEFLDQPTGPDQRVLQAFCRGRRLPGRCEIGRAHV